MTTVLNDFDLMSLSSSSDSRSSNGLGFSLLNGEVSVYKAGHVTRVSTFAVRVHFRSFAREALSTDAETRLLSLGRSRYRNRVGPSSRSNGCIGSYQGSRADCFRGEAERLEASLLAGVSQLYICASSLRSNASATSRESCRGSRALRAVRCGSLRSGWRFGQRADRGARLRGNLALGCFASSRIL